MTAARRAHAGVPTSQPDVLVIGSGPAGLTAGIYLARFRRRLLLLDDGHSRARFIPISRNCPGFAHGVSGSDLLAELREQATRHGVAVEPRTVRSLRRQGDGFVAETDRGAVTAAAVVLATGIEDVMPRLDGLEAAIDQGIVRLCPICDAFETAGQRVGVYGPSGSVAAHARYLRAFASDVHVLLSDPGELSSADACMLRDLGIAMARPESLRLDGAAVIASLPGRAALRIDTLYPFLGARPRAELALQAGAHVDAEGYPVVDRHMETNVRKLYAIGDVVGQLNQIAVGMGHAAIAATAVHRELPFRPLADPSPGG